MGLYRWTLREIEFHREGVVDHPLKKAMGRKGRLAEKKRAFGDLRLLRVHGWPDARRSLDIDPTTDKLVYILKCKPGCWRIYFAVLDVERAFLLLHAVAKKKKRRDPDDTV